MNWKSPDSESPLLSNQKRVLLVSRMTLSSTVFAIIHAGNDYSRGFYKSSLFDLAVGAVLFTCYLLNRSGKYSMSRFIGLFSMNLAFVFYASVVPKEAGVFLYYFPLMAASSALFGPKEKNQRYSFIVLPFVCLFVLFLNNFKVFGNIAFHEATDTRIFLYINAISSATLMILCINFMLNLNESSENQLQQLAEEVKAKNNDLEKANTELDRFLYSTSHDLRSPLSSIKGLINVARYDTQDKKINGYFDMMTDRVDRLESFIKDIIDYSKNARTEVNAENVDFQIVISEVIENLKFVEGANAIRIQQDNNIDHAIKIDRNRLNIILTNLVANAIKYHDFSKSDRWISITTYNSNGTVKLIVADNGTGIKPEYQEKIFEMFYRGTLLSNGSGLGLYIVKQAVEKMNGKISVESTIGQGSTFHVAIPVPVLANEISLSKTA